MLPTEALTGGRQSGSTLAVDRLVDAFAGFLLDAGIVPLVLGPFALLVAVPCAVRLRSRGVLFWASSSLFLAAAAFWAGGLFRPEILVGPLASVAVTAAALISIALPLLLALLSLGRRPQRGLEALYAFCCGTALVSAASLAVVEAASV